MNHLPSSHLPKQPFNGETLKQGEFDSIKTSPMILGQARPKRRLQNRRDSFSALTYPIVSTNLKMNFTPADGSLIDVGDRQFFCLAQVKQRLIFIRAM